MAGASVVLVNLAAAACYSGAAALAWRADSAKRGLLALAGLAALFHAGALYFGIFTEGGLNLGFFNASSLVTWVITLLLLSALPLKPVESLALALFPLAALNILLAWQFPGHRVLPDELAAGVKVHIVSSIVAYSLLTLSVIQASFLALQEYHLHNRHPARVMEFLPPLRVMEELLYQIIVAGFALLTLSLVSGALFLHDIFAQHLVHKTVLSSLAWLVFALLIWGRWRYGWRGRTIIRWNLSGFLFLMLAYFGSKLVLELILKR
jgi:ABC-type uncharacterized transport system permease subunit